MRKRQEFSFLFESELLADPWVRSLSRQVHALCRVLGKQAENTIGRHGHTEGIWSQGAGVDSREAHGLSQGSIRDGSGQSGDTAGLQPWRIDTASSMCSRPSVENQLKHNGNVSKNLSIFLGRRDLQSRIFFRLLQSKKWIECWQHEFIQWSMIRELRQEVTWSRNSGATSDLLSFGISGHGGRGESLGKPRSS